METADNMADDTTSFSSLSDGTSVSSRTATRSKGLSNKSVFLAEARKRTQNYGFTTGATDDASTATTEGAACTGTTTATTEERGFVDEPLEEEQLDQPPVHGPFMSGKKDDQLQQVTNYHNQKEQPTIDTTERTVNISDAYSNEPSEEREPVPLSSETAQLESYDDEDQQLQPTRGIVAVDLVDVNNLGETANMETFGIELEDQPLVVEKDCGELNEVLEEDEEALLTEDAYSLLYTAPFCSRTSLFAWFSITLQGGLLLVTFLDLFDTSKEGNDTNGSKNRMEIPAGSTVEVMIAQFLGMLLTAMVMAAEGDFVVGVTQLIKGYDPRIREQSPHATWCRWLMTGLLQSFFGILLLFDSFILSMQSSTVIDLSLNLTALHFIQEIDNMSFTLGAESGLLGRKVTADCEHVKNLKGYSTPASRKRKLRRRRCLIAIMTVGLLVPYFLVVTRQVDGHYMCENLYIQFGDEYTPKMAHYSGIFKSQGNTFGKRIGGRSYYVDETRTFKVAFCNSENYWTISKLDDSECEFIFRSAETKTFDIIEAADEDWVVNTEATGVIDVDWLKIVCNDCTEDTCSPHHGVCSEQRDRCICGEGRFGINCQFEESCHYFALDQRTRDGLEAIPGTSSFLYKEYTSLYWNETPWATPMFYDRPIYVPVNETFVAYEADEVDSFIIFTGRRWVLYAIPDENLARVVEVEGMPSNWSNYDFNTYFDDLGAYPTHVEAFQKLTSELWNYFPIFFSSPLNYGEDSFGFEPSAVTWMHATTPYNYDDPLIPASPDEAQPVSARFLCTNCNARGGGCLNGGNCHWTGSCVCSVYYSGYQCERVKDCLSTFGCSNAGTCIEDTKTCECQEGSYGSLCQLGLGANSIPDPFFCDECRLASFGDGRCNHTFSQECICEEGLEGKYCNETTESMDKGFLEQNKTS